MEETKRGVPFAVRVPARRPIQVCLCEEGAALLTRLVPVSRHWPVAFPASSCVGSGAGAQRDWLCFGEQTCFCAASEDTEDMCHVCPCDLPAPFCSSSGRLVGSILALAQLDLGGGAVTWYCLFSLSLDLHTGSGYRASPACVFGMSLHTACHCKTYPTTH